MNYKNAENDTGSYQNGMYTTKNGFVSGLGCPKGTKLFNTEAMPAIFFPEVLEENEEYRLITQDVAPYSLPYYAVSNHGNVANIYTGQILKESFKPNEYGYYSLAVGDNPSDQRSKKYLTHKLVKETFDTQVDQEHPKMIKHADDNRRNNHIDNLEYVDTKPKPSKKTQRLEDEVVKKIRELYLEGYSYSQIRYQLDPSLTFDTIKNVCTNRSYHDPDFNTTLDQVRDMSTRNHNYFKLTYEDAERIRTLYKEGYKFVQIKRLFYPNVSAQSIADVIHGKAHVKK